MGVTGKEREQDRVGKDSVMALQLVEESRTWPRTMTSAKLVAPDHCRV